MQLPPRELIQRYAGRGPRYTSYPPVPVWTEPVGPAQYAWALADADSGTSAALYVHLPFCAVRCWYCACNVTVQIRRDPVDHYLDHMEEEARLTTVFSGGKRKVSSLHLGGGTPNFLTRDQLERLIGILETHFEIPPGAERAIEIDSRMAKVGDMTHLVSELGFGRISFGVQDLDLTVGNSIGRIMDPGHLVNL
ncbi:MAG: oxygen-independent coproporphyrinogen-3 oxidase, partial [Myxococcota bacterium]